MLQRINSARNIKQQNTLLQIEVASMGYTIKEDGTIVRSQKVDNLKKKLVKNEPEPERKDSAGCLGLFFSFISPIFGVFCYFIMRKEVKNPSAYIYAAILGFVFGIVLALT